MGLSLALFLSLLLPFTSFSITIDLLDISALDGSVEPNYCNNSDILAAAGLHKSTLGQFIGFECSQEFFHCRSQSDGFLTYRKLCKTGLVYDVLGTQNCNYDYNVKSCGLRGSASQTCESNEFLCSLSGQCVPMSKRCDGHYDCPLEEDEQNCPLCLAGEFACIVSEQCIPLDRRCNGIEECTDGTDEKECDVCGHGLFHCSKSNECVPIDQRCDGRRQCPHGEDELLCKKSPQDTQFTCQSRDRQIPMTQVCDGIAHCPDESDEKYCEMGVSAGAAISFSSNPAPPAPPPTVQKETDYEYEEEPANNGPSFPMLSLVSLPQQPVFTTARPTTTTQRIVKASFSKPKPKIATVHEVKQTVSMHKIVQPTYVEVTAAPRPTTTKRIPVDLPVANGVKSIRYPTKSINEMVEPRMSVTERTVRPKNEEPKQMFGRNTQAVKMAEDARIHEVRPQTTPQHALVVEVTSSPRRNQEMKQNIMEQIGSQINGQLPPELMSKIERLLASELGTRRRKPTSSYNAPLSPSAILRAFTNSNNTNF